MNSFPLFPQKPPRSPQRPHTLISKYTPLRFTHEGLGRQLDSRSDVHPDCAGVGLGRAEEHGVLLEFTKPGKPMQNGFIERLNRSYREAVLNMFVFQSLSEVREQTEKWLQEYNEERPHESLGNMTSREYLLTQQPELSTYGWS